MNKKTLFVVLIILAAGIMYVFYRSSNPNPLTASPQITDNQGQEQFPEENAKVIVNGINMSLIIPNEYYFNQEYSMNLTTNQPYGITFTIQNYESAISEVESPYQLYGISQWDTEETTEEQFRSSNFEFLPESQREFIVDGNPAVKGVATGERGRYTIIILRNGRTITLAADGNSEAHQQITDKIVDTITFE